MTRSGIRARVDAVDLAADRTGALVPWLARIAGGRRLAGSCRPVKGLVFRVAWIPRNALKQGKVVQTRCISGES